MTPHKCRLCIPPEVRRLLAEYDPETEMLVVVSDPEGTVRSADFVYRLWMDTPLRLPKCPWCGGAIFPMVRTAQPGGQYDVTTFGCEDCETISSAVSKVGVLRRLRRIVNALEVNRPSVRTSSHSYGARRAPSANPSTLPTFPFPAPASGPRWRPTAGAIVRPESGRSRRPPRRRDTRTDSLAAGYEGRLAEYSGGLREGTRPRAP
jgi:hypothetical protein